MSISPLQKVTLYCSASQKAEVIDQVQDFGCLHLIDLKENSQELDASGTSDTREAVKYLIACATRTRPSTRAKYNRQEIVNETLEIRDTSIRLSDERDTLIKAIEELKPWGNFHLPQRDFVEHKFWFYAVPIYELDQIPGEYIWEEVARDNQFAYVVHLSPTQAETFPGVFVDLDRRPLSELKDRLDEIDELLAEMEYRRIGLTRFINRLMLNLDLADDEYSRLTADRISFEKDGVFALSGWCPDNKIPELEELREKLGIALTKDPPSENDLPPSLLENPESLKAGENCVTFYKTPAYHSWDPSIFVYYSFAAFFAMIMADAGYALLIGIVFLWQRRKLRQSQEGIRFRNLLQTIVAFSFVYGVLVNSYFGFPFIESLQLLEIDDFNVMMPLAIGIGIFHLVLANLSFAWFVRKQLIALASVGWAIVLLGGFLLGLGIMTDLEPRYALLLDQVGGGLMILGAVAIFVFSTKRPLLTLDIKQWFLRVIDGFMALTRVTSLFGDTLSYLRLFALGLSSARLAQTFNQLAMDSWDAAGFGVLLSILILVLGHGLNLILAIMSGVVHGLRLYCIEFFNWGLPNEGYLFQPFAKKVKRT